MPTLTFEGQRYGRDASETVLDTLSRHGVAVPHSCKSGICQSCLMRAVKSEVPPDAQKGLKDSLKSQNYFLSCCCKPEGDFTATLEQPEQFRIPARVVSLAPLNSSVMRVRLEPREPIEYRAGQFLNLRRPDGLVRSYSIASLPQRDEFIELHVKRIADGRMSAWVHEQLSAEDSVEISQPLGECYYRPGNPEQALLLIGTGCGLAPLYGVIRDALHQGHSGPIRLYHGSRSCDGLYLIDELRDLAREHRNFTYVPCTSNEPTLDGVLQLRANDAAFKQNANLKNWRVFLCGHPDMVNATKKKAFLAGANLKDIHADAFALSR
jgi:NAD(P)H-flavin reductase